MCALCGGPKGQSYIRKHIDQDRHITHFLDQCATFLLCARRFHKHHISPGFDGSLQAPDPVVECLPACIGTAKLLRLPRICPGNDDKVGILPSFHGATDAFDKHLEVHDILAFQLSASLGEDLPKVVGWWSIQ